MLVEATIVVDAPADDVYAILTEYGGPARLRINPRLRAQTVLERTEDNVLCENVWEKDGKHVVQKRRYHLFPAERIIEEEVVGATDGMIRVTTRVEAEPEDQTRLTLVSEYKLSGLWRLLGSTVADKLRQSDEELLEVLKQGLEAEFVEADEE